MDTKDPNSTEQRKRKNYPGDLRVPGTKDYALILTNLMSFCNKLSVEKNEKTASEYLKKISVKLKELGFKQASDAMKKKAAAPQLIIKQIPTIIEYLHERWREGKAKNDEAKEKAKSEKDAQ